MSDWNLPNIIVPAEQRRQKGRKKTQGHIFPYLLYILSPAGLVGHFNLTAVTRRQCTRVLYMYTHSVHKTPSF